MLLFGFFLWRESRISGHNELIERVRILLINVLHRRAVNFVFPGFSRPYWGYMIVSVEIIPVLMVMTIVHIKLYYINQVTIDRIE